MKKVLFTIVAMLLPMLANAQEEEINKVEINGIYYNLSVKNKTAEVTQNPNKYGGDIEIPETVEYEGTTYDVTVIGEEAFRFCSDLTSVTIPDKVISIGNMAFQFCSGLTSIKIPSSVVSIEGRAFQNCSGLTSIEIPEGVTSIGEYAFSVCNNLTTIKIPNSVTSIVGNAFAFCNSLREVTSFIMEPFVIVRDVFYQENYFNFTTATLYVPVGTKAKYEATEGWKEFQNIVEDEGEGTTVHRINGIYYNLDAETKTAEIATITDDGPNLYMGNIVIPETIEYGGITYNVKGIGDSAFSGCRSLTSIEIPNGVNIIGDNAFAGCTSLTSIEIPNSVTSIGHHAFENCLHLTSVTIGNGVTSIGAIAFYNCKRLTSVTIGNSVTSIQPGAFYKCSSLTSIEIPNSVTRIEGRAFADCFGLTEIHSMIEKPFTIDDDVFMFLEDEGNRFSSATLYVPAGTKDLYKATDGWKNFATIIEMVDLEPVEGDDDVNYGDDGDIKEETDLAGTIVNNMYYNIGTDAGGYNSEDGCIVITKDTSEEQMAALKGLGITDEELKQNFTGIIFKVPAGSGKVTVTAETKGNMTLKVKVGNGEPMEMELSGKLKMKVPYSVTEESLVYIYAGTTDESAARGLSKASEAPSLKIYGIEWELTSVEGDVNGDGVVNAEDVTDIVNYLIGNPSKSFKEDAADVNGDGVVNAADIVTIVNFIMSN